MEAKIKGKEGLLRDLQTGAVLNGDADALDAYRRQRAKIIAEKQRDREIATLRTEVADMRSILSQILSKLQES